MNVPLWAWELAQVFWREAGAVEPFPRRLLGPLAMTPFDLVVDEIAALSVQRADAYLADRGFARACDEADRPLRACLIVERDAGFILLDADDPADERTFSLAHELAHFLRDYWQPRRRAVASLGEEVRQALDGLRRPTADERLHALLRGFPIGGQIHLMRRDAGLVSPAVAEAEAAADVLACELLAPADEAMTRTDLAAAFGLPASVVRAYAERLTPPEEPSAWVVRMKSVESCRYYSTPEE